MNEYFSPTKFTLDKDASDDLLWQRILEVLPKKLAELSKKNNLKQFIHISALGIDDAKDSKYASSKISGEIEIKKAFDKYIILKPSIVYSVNDNFTTMLMTMLKYLPLFPLYYQGKTSFYIIWQHCISYILPTLFRLTHLHFYTLRSLNMFAEKFILKGTCSFLQSTFSFLRSVRLE